MFPPDDPPLDGTETEANLWRAFRSEAEANRRYLWFAEQAEVDGQPSAARLFRQLAERETGHAFGHLEILAELGDPLTGEPLEETEHYLRAAIAAETHDSSEMYPGFATTARAEGFAEIATWMETLARAEAHQVEQLTEQLADHVAAAGPERSPKQHRPEQHATGTSRGDTDEHS